MKRIYFIALLASLVNMASCQNTSSSQGKINETISVDDFQRKLSDINNAQLIDVRTPEEYAGGHLKNAVNINYNSGAFEEELRKLDKSKPVMVYCLSGGRSSRAANKMQDMGFSEVYNMDGGIMKWGNTGKPLDKGSAPPKSNGMTTEVFNKMVLRNKYVLVDYNAKWCEPCKKMMPILESVAAKKKDSLSLLKIHNRKAQLSHKQAKNARYDVCSRSYLFKVAHSNPPPFRHLMFFEREFHIVFSLF